MNAIAIAWVPMMMTPFLLALFEHLLCPASHMGRVQCQQYIGNLPYNFHFYLPTYQPPGKSVWIVDFHQVVPI
jgi:hypothetical protein